MRITTTMIELNDDEGFRHQNDHQRRYFKTSRRRSARQTSIKTIIIINLCCLLQVQAQNAQRLAIEPADRTAIVGDTVILPCRVVNKVGTLQWTKDGFGLGTDRLLSGFPRYTMVGNDEEGDFSLQIANVQLEDDAQFQCQVGAVEGVRGIRTRSAVLTVFVPPEPPTIVQTRLSGPVVKTSAGSTVELTCEANAGKPPAELTWLDADLNPVRIGVKTTTQLMFDGKRSDTFSRWTFAATKEMNVKTLTCRSENAALKTPQNTTIRMEVKFVPDVHLAIESHPNERLMPRDNVHLRCSATANPAKVVYKWFLNNEPLLNNRSELVLKNVTKEMNGNSVVCEVVNSVGSNKTELILKVFYPPTFSSPAESAVAVEPGADVTLNCLVDGNPQPEVTWQYDSSPVVLGTGKQLLVRNVQRDRTGRYVCRVTASGFREVQKTTFIYLKQPPEMMSPEIQYGSMGQRNEIRCLAESASKPVKVIWRRNDMIIDIDNVIGYEIFEEPVRRDFDIQLIRSTIIIHQTKENDFGLYNCSASNKFGSDWQMIRLVKADNLKYIAVIIGMVASCVVLIVSMLLFALLCPKRRAPPAYPSAYIDPVKNVDQMTGDGNRQPEIESCSSVAGSEFKVELRASSAMSQRWDGNYESIDVVSDSRQDRQNELANVIKNIYMYTASSNLDDLAANNNGYVTFNRFQKHHTDNKHHPLHSHSPTVALEDSRSELSKSSPITDYLKDYANPYQAAPPNVLPIEVSAIGSDFLATHV